MKRREFLTLPAESLGGVLLYTLAGEAVRLQAQSKSGEIRVPLRFFTATEARAVQAQWSRDGLPIPRIVDASPGDGHFQRRHGSCAPARCGAKPVSRRGSKREVLGSR